MKRKAFFAHLSISKYPFVKSPFAELRPHFDLKVVKLGQKSVLLILRHTFRIPKTSGLTSCYLVNGGAFNYKTLCPRQNPNSFMPKMCQAAFSKDHQYRTSLWVKPEKSYEGKMSLTLAAQCLEDTNLHTTQCYQLPIQCFKSECQFWTNRDQILVNFGFCTLKISKNWVFSQMMKLHRTSNIVQSW